MQLCFSISYHSRPGENVFVNLYSKEEVLFSSISLKYKDENTWSGNILFDRQKIPKKIQFSIFVKHETGSHHAVLVANKSITIKKGRFKTIEIISTESSLNEDINVASSKPFKRVLKGNEDGNTKSCSSNKATHVFKVDHPILQDNIFLCITGSAKKMNLFNNENPVLFPKKKNGSSILKFNLAKEIFPIEYKIAFFDIDKNCIVEYEPGPNNILQNNIDDEQLTIINCRPDCKNHLWKGAGINLPVFSIRTTDTWGSGDFSSIKTLVDYASSVGIKMIQLLPVNDSIASYTEKDSYPYSAISSFALNPLYLDIDKILEAYNMDLLANEQVEILRLNENATCDFTAVIKLKFFVVKRILEQKDKDFLKEKEWQVFFENAHEWLLPYASFCILRDKYETVNTKSWEDYALYSNDKILQIVDPNSEDYNTVLFWYFIQYNLHLQLKESSEYAHINKVILKADLPIGIAKNSVDAWVNPELFHMDMQAGAPPDAFSMIGQNWGFPTYNIQKMREDGFTWFIKRMKSLELYFDALRIDHVLGLFRIWSIPQMQVDGSLGVFVPAIALSKSDITNAGIDFNEERFCKPFISDSYLIESFGDTAEEIKSIFFDGNILKSQFINQRNIAEYFVSNPLYSTYKQQLFNVVSNIIFLKDPVDNDCYHFRINMQQTESFKQLPEHQKRVLCILYNKYFFENQNELWKKEGTETLSMLAASTKMLLCAEDLGMVPPFTEQVLSELNILSLQIQQMPKDSNERFSDTRNAKYPCVVMPATHDMAPVRLWWEQNKAQAQIFYNTILNEDGPAPYFCEPWVCKKIIDLHLRSPAMWSVFLMQDLLSIDGKLRRPIPSEERINDPSNPNQVWNYRMHITLEELMKADELNQQIKSMIIESGR